MAEYKRVLIEWHDEPGVNYLTTVSIDSEWNSLDEDDDNIFFYFSKQSEFEEAKQLGKNGYEFRIVSEENI
jgi:predicted ATP-grasp superfamily ATP-dependent carboligase